MGVSLGCRNIDVTMCINQGYNESIRLAVELGDNGSRELRESILREEESHIDYLEAQLEQIKQMGVQNYLVEQIG
jgi:bacterioferritin